MDTTTSSLEMPVDNAPPAFVTSLADLVDKKLVAVLRDGRKLVGTLRSYDQFANLILQDTVERIFSGSKTYADIPRGIFLIRGENLVILGEIDTERESQLQARGLTVLCEDVEQVLMGQQEEAEHKDAKRRARDRFWRDHGHMEEMESEFY